MKEGMTINISGPIFNNGGTINGDIINPTYMMGKPSPEDKRKMAIQCMEGHINEAIQNGKGPKDIMQPYVAAIRAGLISNNITYVDFNKMYATGISQPSFSEYVPKDISNSRLSEIDTEALVKQYLSILKA